MAIPFKPNPRKPNTGGFRNTKLAECRAEIPNATRLLVHISSGVRRSLKSTRRPPSLSSLSNLPTFNVQRSGMMFIEVRYDFLYFAF